MRGTNRNFSLAGLLLASAACTTTRQSTSTTADFFAAGAELPSGAGREILVSECLNCHELAALELFSGFYNRDLWRSLVITMREYGASVDDVQVEVLSDYLAQNFGIE